MATIRQTKSSSRSSSRNGSMRLVDRAPVKTESLWARYRRTRSDRARNLLVERYRGIVEGMAMAMAARLPSSVDVQDLAHAGMWGLMQSVEHFEPERGINFLAFMRIRVRGAMQDELRTMDYLPRLVRHRHRALHAAEQKLRETLRREPSDAELAAVLGVSEADLWRRYCSALPAEISHQQMRGPADGNDGSSEDFLEDLVDEQHENPIEVIDRREMLEKIQASLQPIEWKVLRLHYLEGMSGKDVARRLRLSASRICQIHGRVLSKLKSRLGALQ